MTFPKGDVPCFPGDRRWCEVLAPAASQEAPIQNNQYAIEVHLGRPPGAPTLVLVLARGSPTEQSNNKMPETQDKIMVTEQRRRGSPGADAQVEFGVQDVIKDQQL